MAKGNFEVGDEVVVRGTVTAVCPDGQTVQLAWAGHKVTLAGDSSNIVPADGAPKPSGKPKRLV
jgi:hypothetical protein